MMANARAGGGGEGCVRRLTTCDRVASVCAQPRGEEDDKGEKSTRTRARRRPRVESTRARVASGEGERVGGWERERVGVDRCGWFVTDVWSSFDARRLREKGPRRRLPVARAEKSRRRPFAFDADDMTDAMFGVIVKWVNRGKTTSEWAFQAAVRHARPSRRRTRKP